MLFEDVYPISRHALIYSEIVTGESNYKGMAEMRDVLEHLNSALFSNDAEYALDNITEAYEHLRRSAVESLQKAATKLFNDCIKCIKTPSLIYWFAFLEIPDNNMVRELRMNAMKKIVEGRSAKAKRDEWTQAVDNFMEAIDYCFELQDMFPSRRDAIYRIIALYATIGGLLLGLWAIFNSNGC